MLAEPLSLWPDETIPATLTFFPTQRDVPRGAVMICPGGGYGHLADHEGQPIARRLAEAGFDAAVLRYRLAPHCRHPDMIHDAQRGMRLMRQHPAIRAEKIAVLGFSAGGHLASTLAVHHDRFVSDDDDLVSRHSARPDAAVLCYAVVDLGGPDTHVGSRIALLGDDADPRLTALLSTHRHVDEQTPPTFLWHTADDTAVPMQNSLQFASACRAAGVPVELHVYEAGSHGLGQAADLPDVRTWVDHAIHFLSRHLDEATRV